MARGNRNIKINGENIKPILADAVQELNDVTVMNQVNVIDYIVKIIRYLALLQLV